MNPALELIIDYIKSEINIQSQLVEHAHMMSENSESNYVSGLWAGLKIGHEATIRELNSILKLAEELTNGTTKE